MVRDKEMGIVRRERRGRNEIEDTEENAARARARTFPNGRRKALTQARSQMPRSLGISPLNLKHLSEC